jgi:YMGG-like Gly-zipper
MTAARSAIVAAVVSAFVATTAGAEVFVYPKSGQSQERFQQDQFECHNWAKGQTGVDPSQSYVSASPPTAPQSGGAVRGGARGAAVGAIGGAIGGDAGKGAAIGAGVGAAAGAIRQRSANQQAAATNQQAQAQQQASLQRYEQAYAACMTGRNYQVK